MVNALVSLARAKIMTLSISTTVVGVGEKVSRLYFHGSIVGLNNILIFCFSQRKIALSGLGPRVNKLCSQKCCYLD